jgi:hypothetical protein
MRRCVTLSTLSLVFAGLWAAPVQAQSRDEFPYSIMREEPGSRPARRAAPRSKQTKPVVQQSDQVPSEKSLSQKPVPRSARRGSSSFSTIPVHRSPVTPLGTAPQIGNVQPLGQPASPSTVVPGIQSNTGPAMTPPRPAGQSFQDRAINCVHSGTAGGVGAGQIGSFTQNCVNR